MADPIEDIIGDYRAFAAQQRDRLATRGIDITPYGLSHLAYRVPEWDQYVHVRGLIERHAVANRENVWNGRPISLIVPAEPLEVLDGNGAAVGAGEGQLVLPLHASPGPAGAVGRPCAPRTASTSPPSTMPSPTAAAGW